MQNLAKTWHGHEDEAMPHDAWRIVKLCSALGRVAPHLRFWPVPIPTRDLNAVSGSLPSPTLEARSTVHPPFCALKYNLRTCGDTILPHIRADRAILFEKVVCLPPFAAASDFARRNAVPDGSLVQ